jgi:DNA-binding FadR family transcriptional regulator
LSSRTTGSSKGEPALAELASRILSSTYQAGALLPTENDLARTFNASRTIIREVIRRLASAGLIETRHGVGSVVSPPEQWNVFDPLVLKLYLEQGRLPAILQELVELRRSVEVESAYVAAQRITQKDLIQLSDWLAQMQANLHDAEAFAQADFAFHSTILEAANNRFFSGIMRYLGAALWESRRITSHAGNVAGRTKALEAHTRVFEAIAAGDAGAAREAMRQHIGQSEEDLKRAALGLTPMPNVGGSE